MWTLAKKTCGSLQKYFIPLGLDFMSLDQIGHIFMNGLRRRFATHDKTQINTWMGKPLVALDPELWDSSSGAHSLSFISPKNHLLEYLRHYGFSQ
jgi:hypothetical protein